MCSFVLVFIFHSFVIISEYHLAHSPLLVPTQCPTHPFQFTKVWFVEGEEDPAELAKARAPPPPPTMSMAAPSTPAAPAPPAADPSDPLAALMAPAGLRVPSRSTPAGLPPTSGMPGMPGMPPTGGPPMNMMQMGTPVVKNTTAGGGKGGAAMPPPTFSVFTPGPTPGKEDSEKREDGN